MTVQDRVFRTVFLEITTILVWLIGIVLVGWQSSSIPSLANATEQVVPNPYAWIFYFAVALILFVICYKSKKFGTLVAISLGAIMYGGLVLFVGKLLAFIIAAFFVWLERKHRSFLSNNLLISFAVLFGALPVIAMLDINSTIIILTALSLYDVLGVLASRFIPTLALGAATSYIPLLLLEPKQGIYWKDNPNLNTTSAVIGSGDIFLPMIVIGVVTLAAGIPAGLITLLGATIGWVLNTIFAAIIRSGIPALPLLAAGMITAYFISR